MGNKTKKEKTYKQEYRICMIVLYFLILLFFSLPILKVFQPKKIILTGKGNKKYVFSIPSSWCYWKLTDDYFMLFDIWSKENVLNISPQNSKQNIKEKLIDSCIQKRACIILRNINHFNVMEIKFNGEYFDDSEIMYYVEELNCILHYSGDLSKKEERLHKFFSCVKLK
ncbi:hypothetical protein TTHT_2005 [Thermotomaculum hydrothermale]|uniref:Uncharacterized protein n=1 Tax=Thermotomaculum hydrothermale TaxID=981385 RepID=A0A7R6PVL9_9BACT|nr:hypothetical protein [Thermotomaculum hydrothermale]BBB33447.1 hypothetical protein TTHT_2005 [Thermotomaculum hydrothermale]